MIRTTLRVSALATAAVLATAVPAHAAKLVVKDAAADVYAVAPESGAFELEGERVNADVRTVLVQHTRDRLVVRAKYADLAKNTDQLSLSLVLRTNEGLRRTLVVGAGPGLRKGSVELGTPRKFIECAGLTRRIDYARNTIRVSAPRRCLSNPRWIQVAGGAVVLDDSGIHADDAFRPDFGQGTTWSRKIKVG